MSARREVVLLGAVSLSVAAVFAFAPIDPPNREQCIEAWRVRADARALFDDGRLKRALERVQEARTLCPNDMGDAYAIEVGANARLGACEEARAIEKPHARTNVALKAERDAALEMLEMCAPRADAVKSSTLVDEGQKLLAAGEASSAKRAFLQAWSADHANRMALAMAAAAAMQAGEADEARRLYERALGVHPTVELRATGTVQLRPRSGLMLIGSRPVEPPAPVVTNQSFVACMTNGVFVVDVGTYEMRTISRPASDVCEIAADGAHARFASEVIDVARGTTVWTEEPGWKAVGFSDDGRLVGETSAEQVRIREAASGRELASFPSYGAPRNARMSHRGITWTVERAAVEIAFDATAEPPAVSHSQTFPLAPLSADRRHSAFVWLNTVVVEDLATHTKHTLSDEGSRKANKRVDASQIVSMKFSPDGRYLITTSNRSVRYFDAATGRRARDAEQEPTKAFDDGRVWSVDGSVWGRIDSQTLVTIGRKDGSERRVASGTSYASVATAKSVVVAQTLDGALYFLSPDDDPKIVVTSAKPGGVFIASDASAFGWIDGNVIHVEDVKSAREVMMTVDGSLVTSAAISGAAITVIAGSTRYEWTRAGALVSRAEATASDSTQPVPHWTEGTVELTSGANTLTLALTRTGALVRSDDAFETVGHVELRCESVDYITLPTEACRARAENGLARAFLKAHPIFTIGERR